MPNISSTASDPAKRLPVAAIARPALFPLVDASGRSQLLREPELAPAHTGCRLRRRAFCHGRFRSKNRGRDRPVGCSTTRSSAKKRLPLVMPGRRRQNAISGRIFWQRHQQLGIGAYPAGPGSVARDRTRAQAGRSIRFLRTEPAFPGKPVGRTVSGFHAPESIGRQVSRLLQPHFQALQQRYSRSLGGAAFKGRFHSSNATGIITRQMLCT